MKYERLRDKTLALFFTAGVSLKTWHDMGMIDREVAVYNKLSKYFKRIYFFTYGGSDDLRFKEYLAENITIIPTRCTSNFVLYSFLLPIIHRKVLKSVDIIKTNQMLGSWSAVIAKIIYRKRLVVRTGYTWSIFYAHEKPGSWKNLLVRTIERLAYRTCDAAITSSEQSFDYVEQKYHPRNHIIIHNYVETNVFKPLSMDKTKRSICFVGRLNHPQKNLFALLDALRGLPYTVSIIGSGEQKNRLEQIANNNGVDVSFLGNIPNHELPPILNQHELFILPSLWEGMPKTLLEAMACGMPVIGTNVEGIKEVLRHGENGILCNTDSISIREAIITVMEDEDLREKLGRNARKTIEEGYSLDKLVERELELYSQLVA